MLEGEPGKPSGKGLGYSRAEWGCQQAHRVHSWSQEFSSNKLGRGEGMMGWWGIETRLPAWPGNGTEQRPTGHELVRLVPLLLTVVQGPQIDNNICAFVDGKLADAAQRERGRGVLSGMLSFHAGSVPGLHGPLSCPGQKSPFLPHLLLSFCQVDWAPTPSPALSS